jgi:uncharacterized protein YxjI
VSTENTIESVDLTDDSYVVEQSLIRNKYKALDSTGEIVIRGEQKMLKMKEEFPFVDPQGNNVFTVKAGGILDVAGNYAIIDSATDETVAILDNDYSILQDTWKIRDGETESLIAKIESRGAAVTIARNAIPFVGPLIPHKYEITDGNGDHVGNIDGQLSFKDRYEISIDDSSGVPKETVIAAAMVIDALQGN